MHTRAFLMYTEMNMYSEQEQNRSEYYMTANASQTCKCVTWRDTKKKKFEDETDSKERSKSQIEQHFIEHY